MNTDTPRTDQFEQEWDSTNYPEDALKKLRELERELREAREFNNPFGPCEKCGLPMSKNPHPHAGKPDYLLTVGAVFVCIPCAQKSNNIRYKKLTRLRAVAEGLAKTIESGKLAIGDHIAPGDCYCNGPMTGNPITDLIACPACHFEHTSEKAIAAYEAWKGGEKTEKPNSQQTWTCSDCHEKVTDISPVGPPGVIICEDCANPKRAKPRTLEYMIEPTPQPEQEQMEGPTPSTEKAFNDTYSYSFDGENYQGSFDSREHAAEEAFAEDDTAQSVWTGRSIVPDRTLSAADVIEQVACSTTEESGDWSDGYLTGLPPKALQELEAELQALWDRWEAKYGLEPNWFNVEDCKEHFRVDVPEN